MRPQPCPAFLTKLLSYIPEGSNYDFEEAQRYIANVTMKRTNLFIYFPNGRVI